MNRKTTLLKKTYLNTLSSLLGHNYNVISEEELIHYECGYKFKISKANLIKLISKKEIPSCPHCKRIELEKSEL